MLILNSMTPLFRGTGSVSKLRSACISVLSIVYIEYIYIYMLSII